MARCAFALRERLPNDALPALVHVRTEICLHDQGEGKPYGLMLRQTLSRQEAACLSVQGVRALAFDPCGTKQGRIGMKSELDWVAHGVAMLADCYAKAGIPFRDFEQDLRELERKATLHVAYRAQCEERDLFTAPVSELAAARSVCRQTIYNRRARAQLVQRKAAHS